MVATHQKLPEAEEEPNDNRPTTNLYAVDWDLLVAQIRAGEDAGLEHLYKLFSHGIRYYLCRQLGSQEFEDKFHDTFLIVVNAIKRGDLREPERLMGFVRTVVRRQVATYIGNAVHTRREQADFEGGMTIADQTQNPEEEAIGRQKAALMKSALRALSKRDRDILVRFYLKEQSQAQICRELDLSETQFRLLKSRAKARFGTIGKQKLASSGIFSVLVSAQTGRPPSPYTFRESVPYV